MKKIITLLYFSFAISEVVSENFSYPLLTVLFRIIAMAILYLGYYQSKKTVLTTQDWNFGIALSIAAIGLTTTYLLPRNENYLFVNSVIYFFEIQIYIEIVKGRFNQKKKSFNDELSKLTLIFTLGVLFIYFCFPMMRFADQINIFIRMMQYGFFLAIIYKNKLVNWEMRLSFWLIVISNILSILEYYLPNKYPLFWVIMPTFFISKYCFTKSLIPNETGKI